jgi:peptidoglycan/xylan/chitin deacetylase (PgdA/CDA1 family)
VILLYHGVVPDDSPTAQTCSGQALRQSDFKRQMEWLAAHHPIVPLTEIAKTVSKDGSGKPQAIAISFDDGYRLTFDCVSSILMEMKIPATFFISTGHLEHGELLWFSYLKAICFLDGYQAIMVGRREYPLLSLAQRKKAWEDLRKKAIESRDPVRFCESLACTYPPNKQAVDIYGGMTENQIKQAGNMDQVEIGAHTVTHPILSRLPIDGRRNEIQQSKQTLSELAGKPIRYFAYPGGDYDQETVDLVKEAGFEAAFAVIPQGKYDPQFEIGRTGIYSASLFKLQLKTLGFGELGRRLGLGVG